MEKIQKSDSQEKNINIDQTVIDTELSTARVLFDKINNSPTILKKESISLFQQDLADTHIRSLNKEIYEKQKELNRVNKELSLIQSVTKNNDIDENINRLEAVNSLLIIKRKLNSSIEILNKRIENLTNILKYGLEDLKRPTNINVSFVLKERSDLEEQEKELIFKNEKLNSDLEVLDNKKRKQKAELLRLSKKKSKLVSKYKEYLAQESTKLSPEGRAQLEKMEELKKNRKEKEQHFLQVESKLINKELSIKEQRNKALNDLLNTKKNIGDKANDINMSIYLLELKKDSMTSDLRKKIEKVDEQNRKLEKSAGALEASFISEKADLKNEIQKIKTKLFENNERKNSMIEEYYINMGFKKEDKVKISDPELEYNIKEIDEVLKLLNTEITLKKKDLADLHSQRELFIEKDKVINDAIENKSNALRKEKIKLEQFFKEEFEKLEFRYGEVKNLLFEINRDQIKVNSKYTEAKKKLENEVLNNRNDKDYYVENIKEEIDKIIEAMKEKESRISFKIASYETLIEKNDRISEKVISDLKDVEREESDIFFLISLNNIDIQSLEMKMNELERRLRKVNTKESAKGITYNVNDKPIEEIQKEIEHSKGVLLQYYQKTIRNIAENINMDKTDFIKSHPKLQEWNSVAISFMDQYNDFVIQAKAFKK